MTIFEKSLPNGERLTYRSFVKGQNGDYDVGANIFFFDKNGQERELESYANELEFRECSPEKYPTPATPETVARAELYKSETDQLKSEFERRGFTEGEARLMGKGCGFTREFTHPQIKDKESLLKISDEVAEALGYQPEKAQGQSGFLANIIHGPTSASNGNGSHVARAAQKDDLPERIAKVLNGLLKDESSMPEVVSALLREVRQVRPANSL